MFVLERLQTLLSVCRRLDSGAYPRPVSGGRAIKTVPAWTWNLIDNSLANFSMR